MNPLKVSLIVPAFNVENYITECLRSICNQSYENWEVIIIDDGSTDSTGLICDSMQAIDNRFIVVHIANSGASAARNYALSIAVGDIIGFIDADDLLLENALESIVEHFQMTSIDAVYMGHYRIDESGNILERRDGIKLDGSGQYEAVRATLIGGVNSYLGVLWNKYFRRSTIFNDGCIIKFFPEYKIGEDQIWLLQVCKNVNKFECEPLPLYKYRIRNNSLMHSSSLTDAKKSELTARKKMVSIVAHDYPALLYLAKIKYRNCVNMIVLDEIKRGNFTSLVYLSSFGRYYYKEVMKSGISGKCKLKESVLQIIYCILDKGKKNED